MELKNLESFIQVAELGSFTKAAKRLGYTQSTVSFQIRQLEEELGVPLFQTDSPYSQADGKGPQRSEAGS